MTDEDIEDLFGEDPDKQETEGYTGNCGPTIEYWYYRAAVTFWPREKNLQIIQQSGFSHLLSYLADHATAAEIPSLASAVVARLEKGEKVTDKVLKALLRSNDVEAMQTAFNKIHSIGSNIGPVMLNAIIALRDDVVNEAALSAIRRTIALKQGYGHSVEVAAACQFIKSLAGFPDDELLRKAQQAAMEGALQNIDAVLASVNSAKEVSSIAFDTKMFGEFVTSVIGKANSTVLRALLFHIMHMSGATENPDVLLLAKHRQKQLELATKNGPPAFSWRQTHANFPGSQANAVNAFLRGDQVTMDFFGFNGISHARNWASKYFCHRQHINGYSANASSGGRGSSAFRPN